MYLGVERSPGLNLGQQVGQGVQLSVETRLLLNWPLGTPDTQTNTRTRQNNALLTSER